MAGTAVIRVATIDDLDALTRFRRAMFAELKHDEPTALDDMEAGFRVYAREAMPAGRFAAWLAEDGGEALGSVGAVFQRMPPTVRNPSGSIGYLLNLYVVPDRRREGIARALVDTALADLRERGCGMATLHASEQGRVLYEKLGFTASPEMRLLLGPQ